MSRTARGLEHVDKARKLLNDARNVEQLRQAQAVLLPLEMGLSLEQTAKAIGRSVVWTCRLRNRFLRGEVVREEAEHSRLERSRRHTVSVEDKRAMLSPMTDHSGSAGEQDVGPLQAEFDQSQSMPMGISP